jgi:hypothetical protein
MAQSQGTEKKEEKPIEWTEEKLRDLYNFIQSLADRYLQFKKEEASADTTYTEVTAKHDRHVINIMVLFLVAVVALMSVLTIYGKVSGDALLFLAGTATGYAFAFVQRFIFGKVSIVPEQEPN